MDQNSNMKNEPVLSSKREPFRVSFGVLIICILLTGIFVFMATYVPLSLDCKRAVENAYGRFAKYDKLIEIAELYDKEYLYEVDSELLEEALVSAYVYGNGDRFSHYYTAEEWAEQMAESSGNSVGIGIYVVNHKSGLQIIQVMSDSPADQAGLTSGDIIVKIDGQDVVSLGFEAAADRVKGEVGTDVVLTISRGSETLDLTVTRNTYVLETVYADMLIADDKKIGYIYITEFLSEETTVKQFKSAVNNLMEHGAQGLIFDVRDNPGGDLNTICSILDFLLPQGPIIRMTYAESDEVETIYSYDSEIDMPMTILVNGNTASAAELFTSALRDYNKGKIVGNTTYGKGCGQIGHFLSDGSLVYITNFLYSPPFSENYDGVGIVPDYEVSLSEEWINKNLFLVPYEKDAQLAKAVEVLLAEIEQ